MALTLVQFTSGYIWVSFTRCSFQLSIAVKFLSQFYWTGCYFNVWKPLDKMSNTCRSCSEKKKVETKLCDLISVKYTAKTKWSNRLKIELVLEYRKIKSKRHFSFLVFHKWTIYLLIPLELIIHAEAIVQIFIVCILNINLSRGTFFIKFGGRDILGPTLPIMQFCPSAGFLL